MHKCQHLIGGMHNAPAAVFRNVNGKVEYMCHRHWSEMVRRLANGTAYPTEVERQYSWLGYAGMSNAWPHFRTYHPKGKAPA